MGQVGEEKYRQKKVARAGELSPAQAYY